MKAGAFKFVTSVATVGTCGEIPPKWRRPQVSRGQHGEGQGCHDSGGLAVVLNEQILEACEEWYDDSTGLAIVAYNNHIIIRYVFRSLCIVIY